MLEAGEAVAADNVAAIDSLLRPMLSFSKKTVARSSGYGGNNFLRSIILTIVFIAKDFSRFGALVSRLRREKHVELIPVVTGAAGLSHLQDASIDLVIVDEQLEDMSGLEFINRLVKVNPLANTALVGALPEEEFHESTEGLGVLLQLPRQPGEQDAETLLAALNKISGLLQPATVQADL